jgi:NAD dependent epimerase/dehydratase family enzyme
MLALDDARATGPLNAVGPAPVRNRDLARAIGRALSRPALLPAPAAAIRLAIGEMAEVVLASQRVVPRRALALGYRFRFPEVVAAVKDLL